MTTVRAWNQKVRDLPSRWVQDGTLPTRKRDRPTWRTLPTGSSVGSAPGPILRASPGATIQVPLSEPLSATSSLPSSSQTRQWPPAPDVTVSSSRAITSSCSRSCDGLLAPTNTSPPGMIGSDLGVSLAVLSLLSSCSNACMKSIATETLDTHDRTSTVVERLFWVVSFNHGSDQIHLHDVATHHRISAPVRLEPREEHWVIEQARG